MDTWTSSSQTDFNIQGISSVLHYRHEVFSNDLESAANVLGGRGTHDCLSVESVPSHWSA